MKVVPVNMRISESEEEKLNLVCKKLDINKSDVYRLGLYVMYEYAFMEQEKIIENIEKRLKVINGDLTDV